MHSSEASNIQSSECRNFGEKEVKVVPHLSTGPQPTDLLWRGKMM